MKVKGQGGIAPFGYRWSNGQLVIDDKEAAVRRLMFELFLKHRRKKVVARILNDLGHRTRNASLFSDTTVDRLLKDPIAKGFREIDGRPEIFEPIVSKDTWEAVNRLLGNAKPPKQSPHLFTGRAFCSCGGRMIVSGSVVKYVCVDCRHKILAEDLESIFLSQLSKFPSSEYEEIFELWSDLSAKERRIVVEQICERIVIDRAAIAIRFGLGIEPIPFKAANVEQQNSEGNETTELHRTTPDFEEVKKSRLTEKEAATFLGISVFTLARRRKAGEIGHFRDGPRAFYSKERHLKPYLTEQNKGK
ncbi:MAG: recombinase family protein, partial [Pyrinomonadaceae bacterium]